MIFDAVGPGCVRSIWQTDIQAGQILKFYFDGEKKPRYAIPSIDFYKGKHPDFPAPLVLFEKWGYYIEEAYAGNCFVPIPFAKSLKIVFQGPATFHHLLLRAISFRHARDHVHRQGRSGVPREGVLAKRGRTGPAGRCRGHPLLGQGIEAGRANGVVERRNRERWLKS